jgi:uncharacterized protein HemX
MVTNSMFLAMAAALILGAALASWFTGRQWKLRLQRELRDNLEAQRKRHEAIIDKLNATHALERKEFDRQRKRAPKPVAASVAERQSTVARLEEQLSAAFVELDRLRLKVNGPAPQKRDLPANGFADTQVYETASR